MMKYLIYCIFYSINKFPVLSLFFWITYFYERYTREEYSVWKFSRDLCNDSVVTMYTERSDSAKINVNASAIVSGFTSGFVA